MRAIGAVCLCLAMAVAGGMQPIATAPIPPKPYFAGKSLREWLRTLIYLEDSKVGKEAREVLDGFGDTDGAVAKLIWALHDPDERVRSGAAEALGLCWRSNAPASPALLRALKDDPSPHVRAEAVVTLTRSFAENNPAVLAAILRTMRSDPVAGVRARAVKALESELWQLEPKLAKPAKKAFLEALRDKDPDVRVEAIQGLRACHMDAATLAIIYTLLRDEDRYVYREACWSLDTAVSDALPELLKGLQHKDAHVRQEIVRALQSAATGERLPREKIPAVIRAVRKLFRDKDGSVRATAAEALGRMKDDTNETVLALAGLLQDSDAAVRAAAAEALGNIGHKGKDIVLGPAGPKVKDIVPALHQASKDKSPAVRYSAVLALAGIDPHADELVPGLVEILKDKASSARWTAADHLGQLGPKAKAAIPVLRETLKDKSLQRIVGEALTKIDEADAVKVGALTILVPDVGVYLKDPEAPRRKGRLRFHTYGFLDAKRTRVEAWYPGVPDGTPTGYVLRGKLDLSKITKATIDVNELDQVEVQYTDEWMAMKDFKETDVDTLIQQLYKPANKVVWDGATITPGGEGFELTLPVLKLIRLGEKARPAVQKRLGDLAIQNEVALILGAIGDESSVAALIDAYPEIDRRRTAAEDHALRSKIVFFTFVLTYLTGQPIGRSRDGADFHPHNKRLWQEWWARAKSDFRVPVEKYNATWVPEYPDVTEAGAKAYRKAFAEMKGPDE